LHLIHSDSCPQRLLLTRFSYVGDSTLDTMHAPLLVTSDHDLQGEVMRLAAAAGVSLDVAHEPSTAQRLWTKAPLVMVGPDLVAGLAAGGPRRRPDVYVVGDSEPDYRAAVALGACNVISLPAGESWLVELLADAGEGAARNGLTIGFAGGSGGVGATTLACATSLVAARTRPTALIDLDPLGPGVERVLGMEGVGGVRWADLVGTSGRLGSKALRDSLPSCKDLAVLGWGPGHEPVAESVVRESLAAARRGHDLVVVDLPRHLTPEAVQAAGRCDVVVLVVGCSLPAAAAAVRSLASLREVTASVRLVARRTDDALAASALATALDLPLVTTLAEQRRLAEHIDVGLGPLHNRRGPVARAASEVLAKLAPASVAA